jgi:hypothetical protein
MLVGLVCAALALFLIACPPGQAARVASDVTKIVGCVDDGLASGKSPVEVALMCGLRDAQEVADLVASAERLAAHRGARARDAGSP